jgi:pyruvate,water dikinase
MPLCNDTVTIHPNQQTSPGRMINFRQIIRKIFPKQETVDTVDVDNLRLVFRERYAYFKQLISANNKALEIMAEIEGALQGNRPFGMAFVRACVTSASVSVFQMVDNLQRLAPEKYDALTPRFKAISQQIDEMMGRERKALDERLVIVLDDIDKDMVDLVGSKMANLGEMKNRLGLRVPSGFVITAFAYDRFLAHNDLKAEIDRLMQSADLDDIENLYRLHARLDKLIVQSEIPPDLATAIRDAWDVMAAPHGPGLTAAMRSSALGEDEKGSSFAGMHRSELNVSGD